MIRYGMTAHGKNHRVFSLYQQSGYYFTRAHYPVLQTVQCHMSRCVTAENAGHSVHLTALSIVFFLLSKKLM